MSHALLVYQISFCSFLNKVICNRLWEKFSGVCFVLDLVCLRNKKAGRGRVARLGAIPLGGDIGRDGVWGRPLAGLG